MKKSILLIVTSFLFISSIIYGQGIDSLIKQAESGDTAAQFNLAGEYLTGQGVPSNTEKAFYWFKKSAEQGYAKAQYMLAVDYYYSGGTQINKKPGCLLDEKSL